MDDRANNWPEELRRECDRLLEEQKRVREQLDRDARVARCEFYVAAFLVLFSIQLIYLTV